MRPLQMSMGCSSDCDGQSHRTDHTNPAHCCWRHWSSHIKTKRKILSESSKLHFCRKLLEKQCRRLPHLLRLLKDTPQENARAKRWSTQTQHAIDRSVTARLGITGSMSVRSFDARLAGCSLVLQQPARHHHRSIAKPQAICPSRWVRTCGVSSDIFANLRYSIATVSADRTGYLYSFQKTNAMSL